MAKETVVAQVGQPTSENEIAIRQEVSGVTIQVEGMVIASEDDFGGGGQDRTCDQGPGQEGGGVLRPHEEAGQ